MTPDIQTLLASELEKARHAKPNGHVLSQNSSVPANCQERDEPPDYPEPPMPEEPAAAGSTAGTGKASAGPPRESQATKLLKILTDVEYFHTPENRPFGSFTVNSHIETHPIRSKGFRLHLQERFYTQIGTALGGQALTDALGVIEAIALFRGKEIPVYRRVGEAGGNIYIDLGSSTWEAIEVRPGAGWRIVPNPPVKFARARGMLALPVPVNDDTAAKSLRTFFNTNPDSNDLELIVAWALAAYRPRGPFPVLDLNSQQGSGKTTTSRALRLLIDPNEAPVRAQPREEADLMIAACNSWLLCLDNLSHLPDWLSDAICRVSTGGAFAKRELYSDEDEVLLNVQRPVIVNGIEELATRGDLMDRALIIELPKIPDNKRRTDKEFWADFEAKRPGIIGYLLNAASAALAKFDTVTLPSMPRMADFAKWIVAAEEALGWEQDTFLSTYTANRREANDLTLDASPIGRHLLSIGNWTGTAADLLMHLNRLASETECRSKAWPQSARGLANAIRRLLPSLREAGMSVEFDREPSGNRTRRIHLEQVEAPRDSRDATGTIGTQQGRNEGGYRPSVM